MRLLPLDIGVFYWLLAAFLLYAAWRNARERRWMHAGFWAVLALLFAGGDAILAASKSGDPRPAQLAGIGVIALALLAVRMRRASHEEAPAAQRQASALRLGHWLFVPALLIPLLTVLVAIAGPALTLAGRPLLGEGSATLIGLALASVIAAAAAILVTREPLLAAPSEGRRLLDTMGWAALLPLVLATLGGVFAASGVGDAVAALVSAVIPTDSRVACLLAYASGMVLFTVIMGNAFAAFPVMTAGIGLPLLIQRHGADPAILGSLGMLTGYCGTLLTPMAANFNLVPAALLELDDPNGVIRAQVPTALPLLLVNVVLMLVLVFR
ncbi:5-oxoproline transporter, DUF979 family subunit [Cognatiluteimonas telluris]|jgi:uncharacterized membrane protein|uniref:5-oxoproline transporter, DUF979 family subunit n=1 Tax=Cognatiluteimonas telluris TaxID=1104775 RepID=UPI00140D5237|nr:DUF979 family protein [Lysobacter telluris]